MPKLLHRLPSFRHHKNSGQAIVTLNGRDIYLGAFNSAESKAEYRRVTAEWLASGKTCQDANAGDMLTIFELVAHFWRHAQGYYITAALNADGTPQVDGEGKPVHTAAGELDNYRLALRPLSRLYGHTQASKFGPLALKALMDEMVKLGWCRNVVNRQAARIKFVFKWAVSQELIPPAIHQALATVAGLRRGKSKARETSAIRPVGIEHVQATLPYVGPQVAALIQLQLLTGARGGELFPMRTRDIDTGGKVWVYRPANHKTAHHGITREIYLGPQAQDVLREFLKPDLSAFIFSPAEAEAQRLAEKSGARKTPLSCGNRPGSNRKERRKHKLHSRWDKTSYRRAIERGCDLAFPVPADLARVRVETAGRRYRRLETVKEWRNRLGVEKWAQLLKWRDEHRWHPHQLRHTAATKLRRQFGIDVARIILGHQSAGMTEVYAEADVQKALAVMGQVG